MRLRRRLDRQERVREALLLDLGAIIFELHRQQRREPELLQAKAAELERVDDEVRALSRALGEGYGLPKLTARGLVAACTACGSIMGVRDRYCPSCGAAAGAPAQLEQGPYADDEPTGDALRLEEPEYDDEIEVRMGEPASVTATTEASDATEAEASEAKAHGATSNGDGPAPWAKDRFRPPVPPESEREGEPQEAAEPWPRHPSSPAQDGQSRDGLDATPGGPQTNDASADGPKPLVPRAQRTLRAGRRLARSWLEERRSADR